MRDARFIGLAADGRSLIVERDGEHLRVPVDDRLRQALADDVQIPMPLQTAVTPREVQRRIRAGESAAQIARAAGVAVELIARFEGPVLDERRWQADRARRAVVDGVSLEERFAAATSDDSATAPSATWDAWVDDHDGAWLVRATSVDGRAAVWSWNPETTRVRGRDDLARLAVSGRVVSDDLEAVLRPVASSRDTAGRGDAGRGDAGRGDAGRGDAAESAAPPPRAGSGRRGSIPSWDEIMLGTAPRRRSDDGDDADR